MANNDNVEAPPQTSLRDELEGLVRSLFSGTDTESKPKMIPPPRVDDVEVRATPTKTNGRQPDTAEQVAAMLRDLFDSESTFVISNAGVQSIIDGLLRRYRERESAVMREKLLAHWRNDVPRLRAALLEAAKDDPLVLDTGQEVSLVTTQKAQEVLDRFCPQSAYLPETRVVRDVR